MMYKQIGGFLHNDNLYIQHGTVAGSPEQNVFSKNLFQMFREKNFVNSSQLEFLVPENYFGSQSFLF